MPISKGATITGMFSYLGAPLNNPRWSWGGVAKNGDVYLRVWTDQFEKFDGKQFVRLTDHGNTQGKNGYNERLRHVELIMRGAAAFGILCDPVNKNSKPREIHNFNRSDLLIGGKLHKDEQGNDWLEDKGRKKIP